jgi:outer membrane receptor protein involved in Fe transport
MRDDIRYLGEDYDSQASRWITDVNKTNRFLFHQDIHALYATFGHSFEDFSFLAGLRAEQAFITSNLVTSDSTIPNNYFKLYPTLHLAYDLSEDQQFQLNYSRRVRRADSDEHNPFAEYNDPRNMEAGNPKIKPEQIHSIELGYHAKKGNFSVLPSMYYRYKYDAFTEIHQFVNDSTMLTTFANIATDKSAGMEFIITSDVKKFISLNLSADAFYQTIDASNLGYSEHKSTVSWNVKIAANLHLMNSNLIQINAYHRSARLTPEGKIFPLFLLNLGMRQELFHQKASITLTVSDVFNSLKRTRKIDTPELYQRATSKRNSQIIYLGFTYRFGKTTKKSDEELKFEDKI